MDPNPYAAPQTTVAPPPIQNPQGLTSPYGPYRDLSALHLTLLVLLGLIAFASGAYIFVITRLMTANEQWETDPTAEQRVDEAVDLSEQISSGSAILTLVTVVVWCIWKNKSCKNAWLFNSRNQDPNRFLESNPTPGWAVGSYFIPILNLWKPFQAMQFIRNQVREKGITSYLLPAWWTTWLLGENGGSLYLLLLGKLNVILDDDLSDADLRLYNFSLILDSASYVLSCFFAAAVIHQLSRAQKQLAEDLGQIPKQ